MSDSGSFKDINRVSPGAPDVQPHKIEKWTVRYGNVGWDA